MPKRQKKGGAMKTSEAGGCYQDEHGPKARRRKAAEREEARDKRSPAEQIVLLDKRLGKNIGARKERMRLAMRAIVPYVFDDSMPRDMASAADARAKQRKEEEERRRRMPPIILNLKGDRHL